MESDVAGRCWACRCWDRGLCRGDRGVERIGLGCPDPSLPHNAGRERKCDSVRCEYYQW